MEAGFKGKRTSRKNGGILREGEKTPRTKIVEIFPAKARESFVNVTTRSGSAFLRAGVGEENRKGLRKVRVYVYSKEMEVRIAMVRSATEK